MTSLQITAQKCMKGDPVRVFLFIYSLSRIWCSTWWGWNSYDSWEKNTVPEDPGCHSIFM